MSRLSVVLKIGLSTLFAVVFIAACAKSNVPEVELKVPSPEILKKHCEEMIGEPRIERISEHVWVAIGYDLANVVLIHTDGGNVIVDTAMSPARAKTIKEALSAKAPTGPTKAIIYTHSHIDHIGGASVWEEEGTRIWATEAFIKHFLKQYGIFRPSETVRAMRQFGHHLSKSDLPCSAIGARMDIGAALESGVRLPTHTFSGSKVLEIGGLRIELHEAHGETHDHLFVWLPQDGTLIPGDNFYWTFPNLYTVRGTSPRPVNEWIKSLDKMRRRNPEHLVPMHTKPIHGKKKIAEVLTNYRDAIQWIRDEVVRGANRGEDIDSMAQNIKLPPHLAQHHYLLEMYGQVDWSVRAIYDNDQGWFDGRPDKLYTLSSKEIARREVMLFGGPERLFGLAVKALEADDARWAVHLLAKLDDSGLATGVLAESLPGKLADSYKKLAESVYNTNGRAYILESALELTHDFPTRDTPKVNEKVVSRVPLEIIFSIMEVRLIPEKAADVYESVQFVFPDENKRFVVTVRKGVAETTEGDPLPGTPEPLAIVTANSQTYRRIAMNITGPAAAYTSGKLKVKGSYLGLLKFLGRFQRGI